MASKYRQEWESKNVRTHRDLPTTASQVLVGIKDVCYHCLAQISISCPLLVVLHLGGFVSHPMS